MLNLCLIFPKQNLVNTVEDQRSNAIAHFEKLVKVLFHLQIFNVISIYFHSTTQECASKGKKFEDKEFQPGPWALWRDPCKPPPLSVVYHPETWIRAADVMKMPSSAVFNCDICFQGFFFCNFWRFFLLFN